jgi:hypothetical protein
MHGGARIGRPQGFLRQGFSPNVVIHRRNSSGACIAEATPERTPRVTRFSKSSKA